MPLMADELCDVCKEPITEDDPGDRFVLRFPANDLGTAAEQELVETYYVHPRCQLVFLAPSLAPCP